MIANKRTGVFLVHPTFYNAVRGGICNAVAYLTTPPSGDIGVGIGEALLSACIECDSTLMPYLIDTLATMYLCESGAALGGELVMVSLLHGTDYETYPAVADLVGMQMPEELLSDSRAKYLTWLSGLQVVCTSSE